MNEVARLQVGIEAEADWVGHVEAALAGAFVEFAQEEELVGRFRVIHLDRLEMPAGHRENVRGIPDEILRQRLAAKIVETDPERAQDISRMRARRLAPPGRDARGTDGNIRAILHRGTKQCLSHGASTDISSADKDDVFHSADFGEAEDTERVGASQRGHRTDSEKQSPLEKAVARRIILLDLENETSSSNALAEFYRFAILLTGQIGKAERVMADTLTQAEGALAQIRNEVARRAWFVARIRERCLGDESAAPPAPRLLREDDEIRSVEVLEIEAYLVAQRFAQLPEPERSALALFYLDSFSNEDIAKLLKLHPHELADTLGRARTQLQGLLRGGRPTS